MHDTAADSRTPLSHMQRVFARTQLLTATEADQAPARFQPCLCKRKATPLRLHVKAMRAVVQRVKSASVQVDGRTISSIGPGLLCLVGIRSEDLATDADFIHTRILNSRLFQNQTSGRSWDESVVQQGLEVLCVSQFTLFNIMKGNKPDFHLAMPPTQAKGFYADFVQGMRDKYAEDKVKDGEFGAMMDVALVNDGPVTIILDSQMPKG